MFSGNSADRGGAIYNSSSTSLPTLANCTFAENSASVELSVMYNGTNCTPTLVNCIVWHNTPIKPVLSAGSIITYSDVQGGWPGEGNIDLEPLFVDLGHWGDVNDPNIVVVPSAPNAVWVDGDYHLKSEAGRWDPNSQSWLKDGVTSPCIDAGDPSSNWAGELWPHGKRINMGAYGGMAQASMSLSQVGDIRDLKNDDSITWDDVTVFAQKWALHEAPLAEDLDRDGIVDSNDQLFFVGNWINGSLNVIPAIDPIVDQRVAANRRLIFSVSATDADGDTLAYLALGLPTDALFFGQMFSWTPGPDQVGTHFVTFVVSDQKTLDFITVQITEDEGQ